MLLSEKVNIAVAHDKIVGEANFFDGKLAMYELINYKSYRNRIQLYKLYINKIIIIILNYGFCKIADTLMISKIVNYSEMRTRLENRLFPF